MARLDVTEVFHGIKFPGHLHTQESLQLATGFAFQDSDVVIVSYPKSGTTWMQQMVTLICSGGDPQVSLTVPSWQRLPWLEHYYCAAVLQASSFEPRVLTSHLPSRLLLPALRGSRAKVVYLSRNPKDVLVSFYHFHKMANFLPDAGAFPQFLTQFVEGEVNYGSWFDHVGGWLAQRGTMETLLHVTYEEMSLDLHGTIRRLSSFLQRHLQEEQVNSCARHCSFSSMRDNQMVNYTLVDQKIMDHSRSSFMRRGKVGDWKNMFSEEQDRYFQGVLDSKMHDWALEFVWEEPEQENQENQEDREEPAEEREALPGSV